jgi:hypothetical protein
LSTKLGHNIGALPHKLHNRSDQSFQPNTLRLVSLPISQP